MHVLHVFLFHSIIYCAPSSLYSGTWFENGFEHFVTVCKSHENPLIFYKSQFSTRDCIYSNTECQESRIQRPSNFNIGYELTWKIWLFCGLLSLGGIFPLSLSLTLCIPLTRSFVQLHMHTYSISLNNYINCIPVSSIAGRYSNRTSRLQNEWYLSKSGRFLIYCANALCQAEFRYLLVVLKWESLALAHNGIVVSIKFIAYTA